MVLTHANRAPLTTCRGMEEGICGISHNCMLARFSIWLLLKNLVVTHILFHYAGCGFKRNCVAPQPWLKPRFRHYPIPLFASPHLMEKDMGNDKAKKLSIPNETICTKK